MWGRLHCPWQLNDKVRHPIFFIWAGVAEKNRHQLGLVWGGKFLGKNPRPDSKEKTG